MSGVVKFDDADLTHPWVERYRIPLLTSPYFAWRYEVALVVPRAEVDPYGFAMPAIWPTEAEAQIIGALIQYRLEYYRPSYLAEKGERLLDTDSSVNTQILVKHEDGWRYRLGSWDRGALYAPTEPDYPPTPAGLMALIGERINHWTSDWTDFMARRPELFPTPTVTQ